MRKKKNRKKIKPPHPLAYNQGIKSSLLFEFFAHPSLRLRAEHCGCGGKFIWLSGRGTVVVFLLLAILGTIGLFIGEKFKKYEYAAVKLPTEMERKIGAMVAGKPMTEMIPYIAQKDKKVAAYLVAIAKKESNWGKFSPQKNNENCYNYWGYRGTYNQTTSGYSCFDSPEQAVDVVGKRIGDLVDKKIDTPKAMALVWKCGWDCSGHDPGSVTKWVSDVSYYYQKFYN